MQCLVLFLGQQPIEKGFPSSVFHGIEAKRFLVCELVIELPCYRTEHPNLLCILERGFLRFR